MEIPMAHSDTHRLVHEHFNNKDYDQIEQLLAPGFMFEDLSQSLTIKTAPEFVDYLKTWHAAFPDATIGSPQYMSGDDFSVCTFHGRGTNDGQFGPFPATGNTIDQPFCEVPHYASDGTVLSGENYYDQAGLLRQLGHLQQPETDAESSGTLEHVVRRMFAAFDSLDIDAAEKLIASQAQGVDEIARRWLRGGDDIAAYFRQLTPMLSDVHSEISDVNETIWGDTGVVTMWIEQDYTLDGSATHVSAPTTMVLRNEAGEWKIALVHSVPIPEEA
jgi:steroid delta-isomerase-like uncharacterized protein